MCFMAPINYTLVILFYILYIRLELFIEFNINLITYSYMKKYS